MIMEVLPSTSSYSDDDRHNLEQLLDMFGSVVSLQDIASAYCQADRQLHTASDILCSLQESKSDTLSLEDQDIHLSTSSNHSSGSLPENDPLISNSRKGSASLGTVSGVIGHNYVWSRPPDNEPREVSKPPKISCSDFPSSELCGEKGKSEKTRKEVMHQDAAEFLYKMLDGFQLDMGTIQDVVGQCGFDMKKSMERLLDLSEASFKEDNPIIQSKKVTSFFLAGEDKGCSDPSYKTTSEEHFLNYLEDVYLSFHWPRMLGLSQSNGCHGYLAFPSL